MQSKLLTSLVNELLEADIMFSLYCNDTATPTIILLQPKKFIEWTKHFLVIPYLNGASMQFVLSDGVSEITIQCLSHFIPVPTIREWQRLVDEEVDKRQQERI